MLNIERRYMITAIKDKLKNLLRKKTEKEKFKETLKELECKQHKYKKEDKEYKSLEKLINRTKKILDNM